MNIKSFFLASLLFMGSTMLVQAQQSSTIPAKATDVSPLLIGESIPDFTLFDLNSHAVSIKEQLAVKPTVLIFYRGGWCPYCNKQMAELQGIESDILKLGYQIIAVSPDSPSHMKASMEKNKLTYQLLSDADMKLTQAMGLAFTVPESSVQRLKDASDNKNPGALPVPAIFVVNQKSEIVFEYINPDFKQRMKGSLLLSALEILK